MRISPSQRRVLGALAFSLALSTSAHAQNIQNWTWDGGGTPGGSLLWSTATNWHSDTAPPTSYPFDSRTEITFAGTIDLNPDMGVDYSIFALVFANSPAEGPLTGSFTLGSTTGKTLTIEAGITNNSHALQTINNNLALNNRSRWIASQFSPLTINGDVNIGFHHLIVESTAGVTTRINGAMSGNPDSSYPDESGLFTKDGAGELILGGTNANTYGGNTRVFDGILKLNKPAGVDAMASPLLVIGNGLNPSVVEVQLLASNQIPDTTMVAIAGLDGSNLSRLKLNGFSETIGSLQMTGGLVSLSGGTLTLLGNLSTLAASGSAVISNGTLDLGGTTRTFNIAQGAATNDLDISAGITNGGITKNGAGTLQLSGNSAYSGPTIVNAGLLIVGGFLNSAVTVNNGGTLAGSAQIGAVTVNSGGTLSPGQSAGLLNVVGDLTLTLGSTYHVELSGLAAGTEYDRTNVFGAVSLGDATLSVTLGFSPELGTMFNIINNDQGDAITGTFNGLAEGSILTIGGNLFAISYHGGVGQNDVVLTNVIPEPSTFGLFISAILFCALAARRRHS